MQQKLNEKVEYRVKANSYGYNNNDNKRTSICSNQRDSAGFAAAGKLKLSHFSSLQSFSSLIETLKRFLAVGEKASFCERGGDAEYAFGGQDLRRWGSELWGI